jgi:antitoxin component YwqK of YwqJK toxin-antitoxin module
MKAPLLSTVLLSAVLLVSARQVSSQEQFYRSNEVGMLLARINPALRDDSRWVIRVTRSGPDEDRRLFDNGKEVRRWQTSWTAGHEQRVERESSGGKLTARRVFDASGTLLQEEEYSAGVLTRKTLYSYAGGRLTSRKELDPDGKELARESYLYADNGGLREVRRTPATGPADVSSFVSGRSGLAEQRSAMDGTVLIERYDADNRVIQRERRRPDGTKSVEDLVYDESSGKLASSRERTGDGSVVDRRYDAEGLLAQETTSLKDKVTEVSSFVRDSKGRVTARTRRSGQGIEAWHDTFGESGEVAREEYFQRGELVRVTVYGEAKKRTEELYRNGGLFLKVFFDGDTRVREEVYVDGTLARSRDFP